jgi:hypothetical protein
MGVAWLPTQTIVVAPFKVALWVVGWVAAFLGWRFLNMVGFPF